MSEKAKAWIVPEEDRPPNQFWIDFGSLVNASKIYPADESPDHDHYWNTLIRWSEKLMNRYNNTVVNHIVMDYIDGQSRRSTQKPISN